MMGKICSRCKVEKDATAFYSHPRTKDGLQSYCRDCKRIIDREYSAKHREERNEQSKQWRKSNPDKLAAQYKRRKEFLISLKKPCVKCGESRPAVIEFHHIDPATKEFNLAYVVSNGSKPKEVIYAELEKCVCLCANCHAEFHERYGTNPKQPVESLEEYLNI